MATTIHDLLAMPVSGDPVVEGLFQKANAQAWDVDRDLEWDREIAADDGMVDPAWTPYGQTPTFQGLDPEVQRLVARRTFAQMLQYLIAGEAVAAHGAARLGYLSDRHDFRYHATAQATDEARHHIAALRLAERIGGAVEPIEPHALDLFDTIMRTDELPMLVIGVQLVVETRGLGLLEQLGAAATHPLLVQMVRYFQRDEARHVAFGIRFIDHVLGRLDDRARYHFALDALPAVLEDAEGQLATREVELRRLAGHLRAANVSKPWALVYRMRAEQSRQDAERRAGALEGRGVPRCLLALRRAGLMAPDILEELGLDTHPLIEATVRADPAGLEV